MNFEWDPSKSAACLQARGFDFAFAARIFAGRTVEIVDGRHAYGETRTKAIGEADGIMILAVIYTDREGARRIISARKANRKERQLWQS